MSTKKHSYVHSVFGELIKLFDVKGFKGLAEYLGVPYQTLMAWKKRDSIGDYAPFMDKGISKAWLETGEGEMIRAPQVNFPHGTDKFKAYAEEVVASAGEQSGEPQTIRQRLGSHDYPPQVWAMADFLDLMTKDMTDEERDAFARELFEDTVRKLSGRKQ